MPFRFPSSSAAPPSPSQVLPSPSLQVFFSSPPLHALLSPVLSDSLLSLTRVPTPPRYPVSPFPLHLFTGREWERREACAWIYCGYPQSFALMCTFNILIFFIKAVARYGAGNCFASLRARCKLVSANSSDWSNYAGFCCAFVKQHTRRLRKHNDSKDSTSTSTSTSTGTIKGTSGSCRQQVYCSTSANYHP